MLKLLINPMARGAYFAELDVVCQAELSAMFPEVSHQFSSLGPLRLIDVELDVSHVPALLKLSWVQAVFEE